MTFSEFRALLGCGLGVAIAMARLDRDALDRAEARVNRIRAQIDARKAAGRKRPGHP